MQKPTVIFVVLSVLLLILLLLCLGGCTAQQARDVKIIYSDGCLLLVEGLTVEQVKEKKQDWTFADDCKIDIRTTID